VQLSAQGDVFVFVLEKSLGPCAICSPAGVKNSSSRSSSSRSSMYKVADALHCTVLSLPKTQLFLTTVVVLPVGCGITLVAPQMWCGSSAATQDLRTWCSSCLHAWFQRRHTPCFPCQSQVGAQRGTCEGAVSNALFYLAYFCCNDAHMPIVYQRTGNDTRNISLRLPAYIASQTARDRW
jgi:hypothetical protein